MIHLLKADLEACAASRATGYVDAVLEVCTESEDGALSISEEDYTRIAASYALLPPVRTQIKSALIALKRWKEGGLETTPPREIVGRKAICAACDWHRPSRIPLLSACGKCGCRGLKLYLATESCPIGKW